MLDYKKELQKAVQHFWRTRGKQKKHQGVAAGIKDTGNRSAVTGGKHADGFGYLFMLEETLKSVRPTKRVMLKPYNIDEAFQERSYAKRYELVCERLVRDRCLDQSVCHHEYE